MPEPRIVDGPAAEPGRADVTGETSERVIRDYVAEVLNLGDPLAATRLISDETLGQRTAVFRKAFPDLRVTIQELVADGDRVAAHLLARGTHLGIYAGCPPTGRQWTAACTAIYRVHDGRIVDHRATWELLTLMEQLGCIRRLPNVSA
jgi:predicted ester cyclase